MPERTMILLISFFTFIIIPLISVLWYQHRNCRYRLYGFDIESSEQCKIARNRRMNTRFAPARCGVILLRFGIAFFCLGLHRIIRQGSSARDFVPVQSFKNGGILYVFPVFETAEMVQKIRWDPLTQLCGVALGERGLNDEGDSQVSSALLSRNDTN